MSPILIFHITVGSISLLSGASALIFRKGSYWHRLTGKVFVISMLLMTATGMLLGFLKPATISVIAGALTFYLVATSWMTVKRKQDETGIFDYAALIFILLVCVSGFYFGMAAARSESGYIEGIAIPAAYYYFFGAIAGFCAILDMVMITRGGSRGVHRIARHLWRMCFALYMAASSLFLGNPQVFPEAIRGTIILSGPVFAVILAMVFWLIRVLFTKWGKQPRAYQNPI